jgi:gliding motility-associated-like protein
MKKDDIEDLFKKSFENYEAEVSPGVWKNVRIGIKWGSLALLFSTLLNKIGVSTIIAILSSAAIITTIAVIKNKNNIPDKKSLSTVKVENKIASTPLVEKRISLDINTNEPNKVDQKTENKILPLDNDDQKSELIAAKNSVETTKKDNKKIESVINKFSKEPIASISVSPVSGTAPLIVDLSNSGTGKTNNWIYGDGKKGKPESNPVHVFEAPGIYSIILTSTNSNGEIGLDSIKVEVTGGSSVSYIPKEFSPNGDGVLDVFVFQTKNIASMKAKIFDKKGTVVYESASTDAKWDGKDLQGKDAKVGIYFYIINAEGVDGKKYEPKGSINLTR